MSGRAHRCEGAPRWRAEVLIPAHRIVLALAGGEVFQVAAGGSAATFRSYRALGLPGAVHGMIAWPNTVLLTGEAGNVVVDPGYATQGDMLVQALAIRGLSPDDVATVVMTHLHSDHVSALPQLGAVDLHVHEAELDTVHARTGRGLRDAARLVEFSGRSGEVIPGVQFIHTPGHTDGHVALFVCTDEGEVAVVGDTLGPDPAWYRDMDLPADHPRRDDHLAAMRAIAERAPARIIPGHYPPM
jgi:glyoxylase-like metal-dependent hydrolase (beta-lactamase superfamily II)